MTIANIDLNITWLEHYNYELKIYGGSGVLILM